MKTKKWDFFAFSVVVIIAAGLYPTSNDRSVNAHPTEPMEVEDEAGSTYESSWNIDDIFNKEVEHDVARFEEGLEDLQKIFGIRGHTDNKLTSSKKIPPQFMMELYNTIADSSGITRGKNPYNARVVRSFIERDTLFSHVYLFNISGLERNESVLEAELHLYRKRSSIKITDPAILTAPYYLIRVYQVLEGESIADPDLHRLLSVHYVGAHASGWQVFNVKQAVVAWVSGAPNLGLLVTASNLFDDEVTVEFSRRNDYHTSKQPILVLFNDNGESGLPKSEKIATQYYKYGNDKRGFNNTNKNENDEIDNIRRQKRHGESSIDLSNSATRSKANINKEYSDGTQLGIEKILKGETDFFHREKKFNGDREKYGKSDKDKLNGGEEFLDESTLPYLKKRNKKATTEEKLQDFIRQKHEVFKRDRQRTKKTDSGQFVSERRSRESKILSSMDIYERAMLREQMTKNNGRKYERKREKDYTRRRDKRSSNLLENDTEEKNNSRSSTKENTTECTRHELYVDFKEIGLSSAIIAPKGYSAYHCQGMCESPLSQDQQPTNHATVQGLVHKMGIVADVHMPCCVPTKLLRTSILFYDDNENVVLKVYEDMVADRCGCR